MGRLADDGLAVSPIRVALAAIRTAHLLAGRAIDLRHPRLAMVVEGVTRAKGVRPRRKAAPAVPGLLRLMLASRPSPTTPLGAREAIVARERAMLLLGFGAALRRSELVGLTIGDAQTVPGRGLLTAGGSNRAALADLMRQSRHRSVASVLGYVEAEDLWRNNVTEGCFGRAAKTVERSTREPAAAFWHRPHLWQAPFDPNDQSGGIGSKGEIQPGGTPSAPMQLIPRMEGA